MYSQYRVVKKTGLILRYTRYVYNGGEYSQYLFTLSIGVKTYYGLEQLILVCYKASLTAPLKFWLASQYITISLKYSPIDEIFLKFGSSRRRPIFTILILTCAAYHFQLLYQQNQNIHPAHNLLHCRATQV